jgi:hypothetical protein
MGRLLTIIALGFGLLWTSQNAQAAHLVGGEITYTCNGSNNYTIKLRVYRDCNSGGAQFDNTVTFTIFDNTGAQLYNPTVNKGTTINVPAGTGNPCLTTPPNICTEYADYVHTMTLPARVGGYTISYQRCCRNATISNIAASGKGNTYTCRYLLWITAIVLRNSPLSRRLYCA